MFIIIWRFRPAGGAFAEFERMDRWPAREDYEAFKQASGG